MKMYSRLVASDLIRELIDAGLLPRDEQDTATTRPAPPGLLISQVGGIIESSAFDLNGGYGTGYILPLHVAVDLPVFRIYRWQLDLPWEGPPVQWLTDPLENMTSDNLYKIPGCAGLMYPRDEVINHRRVLKRGHCLDGLLLGFSFESIPDSYHHGGTIEASLVLIDEMERGSSTPIQLWVNRSAKIDRKRMKTNTRGRLFEKRDRAKDEFTQTRNRTEIRGLSLAPRSQNRISRVILQTK